METNNKIGNRKLVFHEYWMIRTYNLFHMPPCWNVGTWWYHVDGTFIGFTPVPSPSWFPQIMLYLFQGLFKDFWGTFSRTFQGLFFVLSNIHSPKNDQQWTYSDHLILSSPENGGGGGEILVCDFNFFRWFAVLWLLNRFKQLCLKEGSGVPPPPQKKIFFY